MLRIYYKDSQDNYSEVSTGDMLYNPIDTIHDGRTGTTNSLLLYLRNDQSTKYYTNIRIEPNDLEMPSGYSDLVYDETGWGVKLSSGGIEPSSGEWSNIDWGTEISLDDIGSLYVGDTTTYVPFWYLISSPPNLEAATKLDIVLTTYYVENAVEIPII